MQAHIKDSDAASDTTDTREGERATIVRDALRCRMAERTALAQSVAAVARPLILRSDFLPAGSRVTIANGVRGGQGCGVVGT